MSSNNRDFLLLKAYQGGITDPRELAVFMGQMEVESGGFESMHENLNYSGDRLFEIFQGRNGIDTLEDANAVAQRGSEAVANAIYGGRWGMDGPLRNTEPGDGWRFHGRGYVQLTGRYNYGRNGRELGLDLLGNPDLAATPEAAADIALHYWRRRVVARGHQLDIREATHDINGGYTQLADRRSATARWEQTLTPDMMASLARGEVLLPPHSEHRHVSDPAVTQIQENLDKLGHVDAHGHALRIDGRYGPATRHAIETFQHQHSLPVTGLANSEILVATQVAVSISQARHDAERLAGMKFGAEHDMPLAGMTPASHIRAPETQPYIPTIAPSRPHTPALETAAPSRAAMATRTLQLGDTRPAVLALQHQLNQLGHTDDHGQPLQADQHFGPRTQQAVQAFQRHHGLVADGVAGPQTLHSLQQQNEQLRQPAPAAAAPTPPTDEAARAARQASIEQQIAHLQRMAAEEKEAGQRAADACTAPAHDTALWTSAPLPPPRVPSTFADPDHPKHYRYETLLDQVQEAPALQRYTDDQHARIAAGLTYVTDQRKEFIIQDLRAIEVQGNDLIVTDRLKIGQASNVVHGNLSFILSKTPEETASAWREWALPKQSALAVTSQTTASADPQPVSPTDMRHPQEPHHAMFLEARRKLGATYAHHGMTRDPEQLDREAARVTMTLRERQMNEVPTLRLACEPDGRFSTQPGLRAVSDFNMVKFSGEDLQQAPAVEQSSQTLVQVEQRLHEQALAHQQQWAQQAGLGRTR